MRYTNPYTTTVWEMAGVKVEIKRRWNYKIPKIFWAPTFLVGPSITVETLF